MFHSEKLENVTKDHPLPFAEPLVNQHKTHLGGCFKKNPR